MMIEYQGHSLVLHDKVTYFIYEGEHMIDLSRW